MKRPELTFPLAFVSTHSFDTGIFVAQVDHILDSESMSEDKRATIALQVGRS